MQTSPTLVQLIQTIPPFFLTHARRNPLHIDLFGSLQLGLEIRIATRLLRMLGRRAQGDLSLPSYVRNMRQLGKLYAVGTRKSLGIVNHELMTCYKKSRMSKVCILLSTRVELRLIFKLNYLSGLFVVKVFGDRN